MREQEAYSRKTLREIVYEELKSQILKGRLIPGTRLMEVELSKKMGASRTPVREAIKMLAEDNLVAIEPNKGAYVSKIAIRDLLEILEIREAIDSSTSYHAAERINDKLKKELKAAMENYNKATERRDQKNMIKWDTEFHRIIVEATGNKVMMHIAEEIRELVLRFRYLYYGGFKRCVHVGIEHKAIYEAIEQGDARKAKIVAREHIRTIRDDILREYENF